MATFRTLLGSSNECQFHFMNHTKGSISYDLGSVGQPGKAGNVEPGQTGASGTFSLYESTLEQGNVVVVKIRGDNNPGFRFWSGRLGADKVQYINLLGGNGYVVGRDSSEISELTGNGFRVTVDGAGTNDPQVADIFIQVYNA